MIFYTYHQKITIDLPLFLLNVTNHFLHLWNFLVCDIQKPKAKKIKFVVESCYKTPLTTLYKLCKIINTDIVSKFSGSTSQKVKLTRSMQNHLDYYYNIKMHKLSMENVNLKSSATTTTTTTALRKHNFQHKLRKMQFHFVKLLSTKFVIVAMKTRCNFRDTEIVFPLPKRRKVLQQMQTYYRRILCKVRTFPMAS